MRVQGDGTMRGRVVVVKPLGCARTFDGIRRNGLARGEERHFALCRIVRRSAPENGIVRSKTLEGLCYHFTRALQKYRSGSQIGFRGK